LACQNQPFIVIRLALRRLQLRLQLTTPLHTLIVVSILAQILVIIAPRRYDHLGPLPLKLLAEHLNLTLHLHEALRLRVHVHYRLVLDESGAARILEGIY